MPERLIPHSTGVEMDSHLHALLAGFLADDLADSEAIARWIAAQAPNATKLPPLSAGMQLTPRQQIYDDYFDVERHGGPADSILLALGQVMEELAYEFRLGSGLEERDLRRLLDGLTAVLEVSRES